MLRTTHPHLDWAITTCSCSQKLAALPAQSSVMLREINGEYNTTTQSEIKIVWKELVQFPSFFSAIREFSVQQYWSEIKQWEVSYISIVVISNGEKLHIFENNNNFWFRHWLLLPFSSRPRRVNRVPELWQPLLEMRAYVNGTSCDSLRSWDDFTLGKEYLHWAGVGRLQWNHE